MFDLKVFFVRLVRFIPNLSLILTPLIFLPLIWPNGGDDSMPVSSESKCLYVIIMMAVFWSLNPIPLPITSLMPIVLLPLLSLASTETACGAYLRANNILFFGCLSLALAIEKSNLHQRIALKVLSSVSTEIRWMLLGFMMTTMFFSMWIVSTATVAMMLPIADEIFKNIFASINDIQIEQDSWMIVDNDHKHQRPTTKINEQETTDHSPTFNIDDNPLKQHQQQTLTLKNSIEKFEAIIQNNYERHLSITNNQNGNGNLLTIENHDHNESFETNDDRQQENIRKKFYLCIAYSATIGGVCTLTSNGPNLIMKDILENQYDNQDPVDYASWLMFATPVSILICLTLWAIFSTMYFRKVTISKQRQLILRKHIHRKYERLGSITFHEWAVLFVFFIMIMLYTFYKPQFIPGWYELFQNEDSSLSSPMTPKPASAAILCVILLFLIPNRPLCNPNLQHEALLDWQTIKEKLEWGVLIIRGGGFALADAVESSGLSKMVATNLSQLGHILPLSAFIAFISVVSNIVIEFMRTSATASILFPVAIKLSESMEINPLKMMIPCATSCAYAFISPVGSTSNTLIFYHGKMSIKDMIIPGLIAKTVSISLMMFNTFLFGNFFFGIEDHHPKWMANFDFEHYHINLIYPLGVFDNVTETITTTETNLMMLTS